MDSGRIPNLDLPSIGRVNPHPNQLKSEYSMRPEHKEEILRQMKLLLAAGFIQYSKSPFRSPVFCVPKRGNEVRVVFDYRLLNKVTKSTEFPLPNISDLLHKFRGKKYITSLDMKGGYWHIPVKKEHRERLAFVVGGNLFEWN